jgi:hypothetical protein
MHRGVGSARYARLSSTTNSRKRVMMMMMMMMSMLVFGDVETCSNMGKASRRDNKEQ